MSRQHHYLKTDAEVWKEVQEGRKTAEFRFNDRNFKVLDFMYLKESIDGEETGKVIGPLTITHILDQGYGMPEGYCMISFNGLSESI